MNKLALEGIQNSASLPTQSGNEVWTSVPGGPGGTETKVCFTDQAQSFIGSPLMKTSENGLLQSGWYEE